MKTDKKNPIISSLISIISTFILSIVFFCVCKPSFIIKVSNKGVKVIDYYLLVLYSLLFGVFVGIIILFIVSGNTSTNIKTPVKYNFTRYIPQIYTYSSN